MSGAAGLALYVLLWQRRGELQQGMEAAKSRHWGFEVKPGPDPHGFLMQMQPQHFKNPLYPIGPGHDRKGALQPITEDGASSHSGNSEDQLLKSLPVWLSFHPFYLRGHGIRFLFP